MGWDRKQLINKRRVGDNALGHLQTRESSSAINFEAMCVCVCVCML